MTQLQTYLLLIALSVIRVASFTTSTSYGLEDNYQISNFQSYFDFFTDSDPTGGYVDYVDLATAQSLDLFDIRTNQVYIGVDNNTIPANSQRGRRSVRLQSKKSYNHGLFILDLAHMPGGQCGTWPAFWLISTTKPWPYGGEVDIIEGVNSQTGNSMTMHTDSGCVVTENVNILNSSVFNTDNCDIHAAGQDENQGCNINNMNKATYGTGFNAVGGGVYATEWNSDHIAVWFFPRASIPADIAAGNPIPGNWGLPLALFQGGSTCNIDQHFVDQQMIFDITFCGQWAGQVWPTDTLCHSLAATCTNYVQNNPSEFTETYWLVNSLKVYQSNGTAPSSSTSISTGISTTTSNSTTTATLTTTPTITTTSSTSNFTYTTPTLVAPTTTLISQFSTTTVSTSSTTMSTTVTSTTTVPSAIISASQTRSQTWSAAGTTWSPGSWWGWQSQARLAPTGGWRQNFWGPP